MVYFLLISSTAYCRCIDVIQGVQPDKFSELGMPVKRDPDALPPRNVFEWIMSVLYHACLGLGHGSALYAIKAGLFTVLLCFPFFFKNSAQFAYGELALPC